MLQKLLITLAKDNAGDTSRILINEIRHVIYSSYQAKEITKNAYNNMMNSIKLYKKMDTVFMNSKNSKTNGLQRLILNLLGKMNLKESDKYFALSNLSVYYPWKNKKLIQSQ